VNLELSEEQNAMRETFARFFSEQSSMARVRAAAPSGFDQALWTGLAELGAFAIRTPTEAGGLGLGLMEAAALMEDAGRTLASGPLAETLVAAQLLAALKCAAADALLAEVLAGQAVVTIAPHDVADSPVQWISGGAIARAVIARSGGEIILVWPTHAAIEPNLATTPIAELNLAEGERTVLSSSSEGLRAFDRALEEWKLLMAAALAGLSREAVRLAAAYACERHAFGQPIGAYQAISHPLADLIVHIDGGKYFIWKTIYDIAHQAPDAGAEIALALWWNADVANRAGVQALHTFGGYGLTIEFDIHLYTLRAKAWSLVFGDRARLLEEAGRRLYAGESVSLPDAGGCAIDFDLGAEAGALSKELDDFFRASLTPELKATEYFSREGFDHEVYRKLAQAGLLFPSWPKQFGGRDAQPYAMTAAMNVAEDHGWNANLVFGASMVGAVMQRFGSDELKKEALSRVAAGEALTSLGYSEPGSGSDVFAARTRATRDGDGWRIDGQKMFTSRANMAEYVLLLARTDPDAPKHKGLTMFIVPLKAPGVSIQPVHTFQDELTNVTFYDGVRIPDTYRLGEVNGGVKVMAAGLEMEHGVSFAKTQMRVLRAAETLCRQARYRGAPLIDDMAAQARLARARAHAEIASILSYRALWAGVEKKPNHAFGPMVKLFSTEKFREDSSDLLDLTSPLSLSKRSGPARFINHCYRRSQATTIYGGTSEIHRSMIAERALGLPRTRA
jgi:alkylation response protein AidB-like acyl-CoA dehydrogenase